MPNRGLSGFAMADFRSLINELLNIGYVPRRLRDLQPDRPDLYLRHDVDLSLELAVEMARVEADLGVFSTYFVLISTEIYNPSSSRSRLLLSEISDLGHEIGLHFDVTQANDENLDRAADRECEILSMITGKPVETISFHRPARNLLDSSKRLAGRRHTYEPDFFSKIAYISDSNGGWHHGHPLDHPAVESRTAIHLLTHPIWWTGEDVREAIPIIREFVTAHVQGIDDAIAGTITAYGQWRSTKLVDMELGQSR